MVAVQIMIGFLIMILGRWNYALFAGGVVFYLTSLLLERFVPGQSLVYSLILSAVAGFLAGFASYVLKRIIAYIVVFLAGGALLYNLVTTFNWNQTMAGWIALVVTGAVCVGMALVSFDFTLILVSTLFGASIVVQYIQVPLFSDLIWFMLLAAIGLVVQIVLMQYGQPSPD